MYSMTGMPTTAMVLAVGRGAEASCESRSAARLIMQPVRSEAGRMVLWAEVRQMARAICGATMPTKPSGPQNAVTAPVSTQLLSRARNLMPVTPAPAICANSSPKSMMSSPLRLLYDMMKPIAKAAAIIRIWGHVELEKLPAVQL